MARRYRTRPSRRESYVRASEVKITRPDGTVETRSALSRRDLERLPGGKTETDVEAEIRTSRARGARR